MSDSSNKNNLPQYPESEFRDEFAKWIKATVSDVLPFGNTATSIFSSFVTPKFEQRREEFFRDVAYWIMKLSKENEAFKPDNLMNNENFISSIQEIVSLAIKTHNKEKLKSLRNALLNIISFQNSYDIQKLIFINEIDSLTELHLSLLKFIWDTSGGEKMYVEVQIPSTVGNMKGLSFQPKAYALRYIFDEYRKMQKEIDSHPYLFNKLISDLKTRELIEINERENKNDDKFDSQLNEIRTVTVTMVGNDFITLIQDPSIE